jgi:two-component system sensor histidine kinase/response regulator
MLMNENNHTQLVPSEKLFRALVQNSSDMISLLDAQGNVIYHSPSIERLLGYRPEDRIGHNIFRDPIVHPDDSAALRMFFEKVRSTSGVLVTGQFRIRRADGSWRDVEVVGQNFLHDPAVAGIVANYRDVTERKQSEEELRRTTQLLQAVVDGTQDAVYVKDRDGRHLMFNSAASRMVGKPAAEVLGRDDTAIFGPEDARPVMAHDQRVLASGIADTDEKELTTDGMARTYLASKAPYRDGQGNIIGIIGICHDITERKRAEEALKHERYLLHALMDNLPDGIYFKDAAGRFLRVNKAIARSCCLDDPAHAIGLTDFVFFDERLARQAREDEQEIIRTGKPIIGKEEKAFDRGRHKGWFSTTKMPLHDEEGTIIGTFGISHDITPLKLAEEALRQANERVELAVRSSNVCIWECEMPDGRIENAHLTLINVWESLGYDARTSPPDFSSAFAGYFHPDDQERVNRELHALLASDGHEWKNEYRVLAKDGSIRWLLARGTVLRDSTGNPVRFIGSSTDITDRKRAEEALRERERQVDSLLGHLPGLAYRALADEHWTALFASKGIEALTGYAADEFTSRRLNYADILLPEDRPATSEAVFIALRDRRMYEVEHRIRHKDGSVRWIWARGHGVFAPDGSLRFIEGLNLDITPQKQAEEALRESEERFRGTFENAAVGIAHVHPTGQLLRVNQTCCAIVGYSREELRGRSILDLTHPDDVAATDELFTGLLRGDLLGYTNEKRYTRKDGSPVWCQVDVSLQRDAAGKPAYAIGIIQDISERKRLEGELRQAKEVAEAANHAKDEFLANVSHEIRTPMNAILGMAELTLDTPLTDEQRNNLNIVLASAEGLLSLINDLLDFSKIEAGRIELEEVDFSIRTVLNQTLQALALRAHKKGMELACQVEQDVPDGLVGDGNRLRQVLLNLIGNAIKFTEAGEVIVRVRAPEARDQSVVIEFEIKDTGIGIAPEKQEVIFQAFEQADSSTTRRYGGTGLGLTIASRLVVLMGGKITVESELGRGSTFRFSARFGRSSRLSAAPALPPVVDLHGLRVLIVDDNTTNRTILHGWARAWRMISTATADVPAAMSALWRGVASKEPFALVLLDARMPGMDGLELAKEISHTPELSTCQIILLTSDDRPGDARRYRALRISAVLMKPVQQEELLDNIYRVLSHGPMGTEIAESVHTTPPDTVHEPTTPGPAQRSSRSLKVLVAEDNRFNQPVIQRILERRGHTVRVVPNGRETLAALEQSPFDLLLLDVNMPEMDGFQVVRIIREREKTSGDHLCVIALTALSGMRDRERCIEAGMDEFLVKPVRAADVYAALERLPPTQPEAPEMNSSVIDATTLLSACAGDALLLADMIQLFYEEEPELLARVDAAVRSSDSEQLRKASHALRGLVSAFSASASKAVEVLEQMGTEGRVREAGDQYQTVNQIVQDVRAALATLTIEKLHKLA